MAKSELLKSSIAKVAMALSGLFLMLFLTHFINMTSVLVPIHLIIPFYG
jgi:hypothetical protein